MRIYAEIYRSFVVGFHERNDMRRPEFEAPRIAVRVDMLTQQPSIGDEWTGRNFIVPSRPNPNLAPPPATDRELLEQILAIVEQP